MTRRHEKAAQPAVRSLLEQVLSYNTLGPIVFVTPEIGRFSTVGGIGVMVDELTQVWASDIFFFFPSIRFFFLGFFTIITLQALAAIGLEIHIISPYYNFNRKGKTDYLAAEGSNLNHMIDPVSAFQ